MVNPEPEVAARTQLPFKTVSRIGVEAWVVASAPNGELVGYFQFDNGEISSANWLPNGYFGIDDPNCNDIMIDGKFWDDE